MTFDEGDSERREGHGDGAGRMERGQRVRRLSQTTCARGQGEAVLSRLLSGTCLQLQMRAKSRSARWRTHSMRCMLPTGQTLFSRAIDPHAVCES